MKIPGAVLLHWRTGLKGAALCALAGLLFLILPFGEALVNRSYDLPFYFRDNRTVTEAVIVYMDEKSELELGQGRWDRFDRKLHARLIEKLTEAGAKAIVFDILFLPSTNHNQVANQELVQAARMHGKVAVAGMVTFQVHQGQIIGPQLTSPFDELSNVAAWGVVEASDASKRIREHYRDTVWQTPSLAWRTLELTVTNLPGDPLARRWMNFYGPAGQIPHVSYADVLANLIPSSTLSNKAVFVGATFNLAFTGGTGTDDYATPYTPWTGKRSPGVEVNATAYVNLLRQDWLRRLPPIAESLLIVLSGAIVGFVLSLCRPLVAAGLGIAASFLVAAAAIVLVWQTYVWFPWTIIAAVQIPCAIGWTTLAQTARLIREKRGLEQRLAFANADRAAALEEQAEAARHPKAEALQDVRARVAGAVAGSRASTTATVLDAIPSGPPRVPDHELLRRIGQGAYGEVWLARDIIGTFHAVKVVYRDKFEDERPYEREFNGLRRFTPISRSHPGFVHILHVGRNQNPDYIYYVMELCDDEMSGQRIDPATYSPRNLAKELQKRKRLPLIEALSVSLNLAVALEYLHQQHLIHRDIKPSNIIFVNGAPKFADIGLVTGQSTNQGDVTYVGTRGYIPPEGPGTAFADVFSLGKLIYEAAFGLDSSAFPDLPITLITRADEPELFQLNAIVLKACENDPIKRYQSAGELSTDLGELLARIQTA